MLCSVTNMGMGLGTALGVGTAVAGTVAGTVGNIMKTVQADVAPVTNMAQNIAQQPVSEVKSDKIKCPKCNVELPANAKFCFECGCKIETLADDEIICPKCGEKTKKGKFCCLCGAPLVNKCSKCGTEIPPNGKFCLNCGEKLS